MEKDKIFFDEKNGLTSSSADFIANNAGEMSQRAEEALANAKKALEDVKTAYPLNSQNIVDATCKVDNLQKGLDILRATQKELGLE